MAKELFACAPIALCMVFGASRPACAASPPEVAATLEIDTRILDSDVGTRIEAQLAEQLGVPLAGVGYVIAMDPSSTSTVVRIRVVAFDADARDYEVEVQASRSGLEPVGGTIVCNACSENRLISRILEDAPGLLEVEEEAPVVEPVDVEPAVEPTTACRKPWPIGPMGISGAVLGVAGIVGVSVGAQRLGKGEDQYFDVARRLETDDYRPAGATATGLGAAVLIAGVVLVVVDVKRRRTANLNYGVQADRTYLGFQVEHRF
jgi:hypothetical protein